MSDSVDSKLDIKQVIRDSMEEYMTPLREEIEQLSKSINKDIKMNYLSTISRVLEKEAEDMVSNFTCAFDISTGLECKSNIKERISKYIQALAMGDIPNAMSEINQLEKNAKNNAYDPDRAGQCAHDWKAVVRIVKRHKDIMKELSSTYSTSNVPADVGEFNFDTEKLYTDVIFPFSHPLRIKIVHSLMEGGKRFTTLKNELNVKNTGLLVHHLKPLTEANLVIQDHRKQYSLSEKGYTVVRYFSQLTAAFEPMDVNITMLPLVVLKD